LETNYKFWVDLETIMLNFRKILPRPTWSVFNITQNPQNIFKSNQSHWKAISKQKRVKNSGLRGKWFTEIVSRFYDQKAPTFCHQNRVTVSKSCHVFDSISSKKQLFKSAFSTILGPSKVQNQTQTHPILHTNVI